MFTKLYLAIQCISITHSCCMLYTSRDCFATNFLNLYCVKNDQDHNANGPNLDIPRFHPQIQLFLHHPCASCH